MTPSSILPLVSSQLVDMIASVDHMATLSARLASVLYDRWNHHHDLVTELLNEISRKDFSESSKTMSSTRNLSHFIVFLSGFFSIDYLLRPSSICCASQPSSSLPSS